MKNRLATFAVALWMAVGGGPAMARNITPLNGMSGAGNPSCFLNTQSRVTNQYCQAYAKWQFDAPVDINSELIPTSVSTFYGRGAAGVPVNCWLVGTTEDGTSGWAVFSHRYEDSWGPLYANGQTIQWFTTLHADCDLPPGGGVSGLWY